ncbi:hypothetical protein [Pseudoduganella aquatica]|uniref:Uncharacterized protein n=1 Tax=Pseudoduganella aquatica TaxID=2660641 RepID=A0A7X4KKI2_9BURK|nr:hypothetical protein [Pseudoduganella aquatica]MYN05755.1 hypothetical protein [Pseudoduganella aquatica]
MIKEENKMSLKKNKFFLNLGLALISAAYASQSVAADLYAQLERDGNTFKIASNFSMTPPAPSSEKGFLLSSWPFKASNLDPAFDTKRFECVINSATKSDGCEKYRNNENSFVYVNTLSSFYGKTPDERRNIENRGGSAAGENAKAVAGGVLALPFLVVASPLLLLGQATKTETKKWVEFNHEEFMKAQEAGIKNSGFSSKEDFFKFQVNASKVFDNLNKTNLDQLAWLNGAVKKEREALRDYVNVGIEVNSYSFSPSKFVIPQLEIKQDLVAFESSNGAAIKQYYDDQYRDFAASLEADRIKLRPAYEAKLKQIEAAEKERLAQEIVAEKERIKQEKIANEQRRLALAKEAARLESFRKTLKVGEDTFCGPVIEVKYPMIKVAISAPLPGFASETWLKSNQVFPSEYGCRNVNGKLSPLHYF